MEILFNTTFMTAFCIGIFLSGAFFVGLLFIPKDKNGKYKRYNTPIEGYIEELEVMKTLQRKHS